MTRERCVAKPPGPSNDAITPSMADLAPEDVRRLAASLSLPLTGDDAAEIVHRLNALLDALAALDALPLEQIEPWPTRPEGIA